VEVLFGPLHNHEASMGKHHTKTTLRNADNECWASLNVTAARPKYGPDIRSSAAN